jgi:alkylation response protein AidB-like acyl-CoA dehydrogenase
MDFNLTVDQQLLAESVRDFLADTHGPEVLRRLDAGEARDPAIWRGLVEMGLTGLLVPEDQGGLGMGLIEAAAIARECGRVCLAEPLVDTAFVAVPWLAAQGDTDALGAIARGERRVALPHAINPWVADGDGEPIESVDPMRRLTQAPEGATDDPLLLDLGALMSAAQLIGLAEAMRDQATEYAKIRRQFGQPIGGFQAVKHQLADCAVAIEFATPVVWRAAEALANGRDSASVHVSHAKLAATDAASATAETAIQVHGAMGYTYEVDLHFWMKRSWALSGAWGDRAFHYRRIEDAVIGGALPIGPEHSFA